MGMIWENSFADFLIVTVFLGGGAAYMTGRAVAQTWRPLPQLLLYLFGLACAVRFVHYALFGGTLVSLRFFVVDLVAVMVIGSLGFRITKTNQIVGQYSWLYERRGPLSWRARQGGRNP
jgi:hypothetical protein